LSDNLGYDACVADDAGASTPSPSADPNFSSELFPPVLKPKKKKRDCAF